MPAEPLITWPEPIVQLLGFIAAFLTIGAVGFRYSSLRGAHAGHDARVYDDAGRRSAVLGLIGSLLAGVLLANSLPALAERRHTTVAALVTGNLQPAAQVLGLLLAVIGFALAASRHRAGWAIAAFGVIAGQLRGVLAGDPGRLVNPAHVLFGGLWIGTLFMLAVAGFAIVLRDEPAREHRGRIVADMVNRFSPLALGSGAGVVLFGVITAWRHLRRLDALWTTPYGYALLVKLALVAGVFALGAWNWRRRRPTLGTEPAAVAIRRSATMELAVAGLVLLVTSVLVSLPSPPRSAPPPPSAGTPR